MSGARGRPARLIVNASDHGAMRVLALAGDLDLDGAPRLAKAAGRALTEDRTEILLDLCDVSFIDSTGLSVLLTLQRRLVRRQGHLRLACAPEEVVRAMKVTRLIEEFDLYATRADALAAGPSGS